MAAAGLAAGLAGCWAARRAIGRGLAAASVAAALVPGQSPLASKEAMLAANLLTLLGLVPGAVLAGVAAAAGLDVQPFLVGLLASILFGWPILLQAALAHRSESRAESGNDGSART